MNKPSDKPASNSSSPSFDAGKYLREMVESLNSQLRASGYTVKERVPSDTQTLTATFVPARRKPAPPPEASPSDTPADNCDRKPT